MFSHLDYLIEAAGRKAQLHLIVELIFVSLEKLINVYRKTELEKYVFNTETTG